MPDARRTPPWTETAGSLDGDPANRIRTADGLLLLSDFDGTLADIKPRPEQARIRPESRRAISAIAELPRTAVGIVSGRGLADVRERVGIDGISYAGNHGLEIQTPDRRFVHPDATAPAASIEAVCQDLHDRLAPVEGAIVEEKGLTASVHYRQVSPDEVDLVRDAVRAAVEANDAGSGHEDDPAGTAERERTISIEEGKQVIELRPNLDWDKGRAVEWLRDVLVPDDASWHPVYVGDDVTDEDAFRALSGTGTTVKVGDDGAATDADFRVSGTDEVATFLEWVAAVRGGGDGQPT